MSPTERTSVDAGNAKSEQRTIRTAEENVRVWKRAVTRGRVRIRKVVREEDAYVEEPLVQETVEVMRVPVGRVVEGPVPVRHEGDTMIIPVLEEVLVVEKRLVLREELHITKTRTTVREVQHVPLRKTDVLVERSDDDSHREV